MSLEVIAALAIFAGILIFLYKQQKKNNTLSRLVLLGLILGSLFGLGLQLTFGEGHPVVSQILEWSKVVGSGYVGLLKMVIMPLVLISMISAVVKLDKGGSLTWQDIRFNDRCFAFYYSYLGFNWHWNCPYFWIKC